MKPSRVRSLLEKLLMTRWPVFLWGPPGIGKSSIVAQAAKALELQLLDVRAALLDPTDIRGIPSVESGRTIWCAPGFLPSDPDSKGVIFLDELNAAPPLVQTSLYQLTLDRRIGEYVLPDGWRIVAAGNRSGDGGVTFRLPSPLANRFIHTDVEPDLEDWCLWAAQANVHFLVVGFLNSRPKLLFQPYTGQDAFATPRSWEIVSDVLKQEESPRAAADILPGIVGEGPAAEFIAYTKDAKREEDFLKILEKPETAPLPSKLNEQYALVAWLVNRAHRKGQIDAIGSILLRLKPEFGILLFRGVVASDARTATHKTFQEFSNRHREVLV